MKKIVSFIDFYIVIGMLALTGCGHNVQTSTKGIGINMSWQSDSYVPSVKVGYWDVTNATIRGNTTYTTTTATGGSLFNSGGTQTTTQMSTGLQINQGNLVQILTSKENSDQVKIALVKILTRLKTAQPVPTVAKTVVAAGGTGKELPEVKPVTTSTDKIIQTAGQVAKTAVPVAGEAYKSTTSSATSIVSDIKEAIIKVMSSVKAIVIAVVILLIIIAGIAFYVYRNYKKKKELKTENKE